MKKILLSLLMMTTAFVASAQTIGEAFYIYRNDGGFNAFFRNEVDSIAFSNYDADSVWYDDVVTQVVYTPDSTYCIPLAVIDSVGFVTPKTVYQPGVKVIDELSDYVVSSDSLSFVLALSTPKNMVPKAGDKVVTTLQSDGFPEGFFGGVTKVETTSDGIHVECERVSITDIYEVFYGTTQSMTYTDGSVPKRIKGLDGKNNIIIRPGRFPLDLREAITAEYEITEDLALDFTPDLAFIFEPSWNISAFVIVTPQTGLYASAVCVGDYLMEERLGLSGTLKWNHDFNIPVLSQDHIPVYPPFLYFYDHVGAFLRAEFTAALKWKWNQHYRQVFVFEYSSNGEQLLNKPMSEPRLVDSSHSDEGLLKGAVSIGGFIECGLTLIDSRIDKIDIRGEYGLEATSQAALYKQDYEEASRSTALYEQMRDCGITVNQFWNVSLEGAVGPWGISWTPLHGSKELWRMSYVPEFSNVTAKREGSKVIGKMRASEKILNPVEIGFALVDKENNQTFSEFSMYSGNASDYQDEIANVSPSKTYTMYPTVKAWDYTMLANPTCEVKKQENSLCPDNNHPHMIDLGLPSSTKWACCNVDASSPEEYGGYYALGETEEKEVYNDVTYKYFTGVDENGDGWCDYVLDDWGSITSYLGTWQDLGIISGTQYDVAYMKWGGGWHMPNGTEYSELRKNCFWTWKSYNDVNGLMVTGPNGNKIFLPAAGIRSGSDLVAISKSGCYWIDTSWVHTLDYCAILYFNSNGINPDISHGTILDRSNGATVRPVKN